MALRAQRRVQAAPDLVRKRKKLPVTIKLNGFARRVENDLAVVATLKMSFQSALQILGQTLVQIA